MSDRSSAYIFGNFFKRLANDPTAQHLSWAKAIWKESLEFDFSPDDMGVDSALKKLKLARSRVNPDYPDEGKVTFYGPEGDDRP